MNNKLIGWNEWCSLPTIGIPAIKAKIDTGATTSCLHAFYIEEYKLNRNLYIKFHIHPLQKNNVVQAECNALVIDKRTVVNSGGYGESRYFINSLIKIGDEIYDIELNLSNRDNMIFKMLIGRNAIRKKFLVDPDKKFLTGKLTQSQINKFYNIQSKN